MALVESYFRLIVQNFIRNSFGRDPRSQITVVQFVQGCLHAWSQARECHQDTGSCDFCALSSILLDPVFDHLYLFYSLSHAVVSALNCQIPQVLVIVCPVTLQVPSHTVLKLFFPAP